MSYAVHDVIPPGAHLLERRVVRFIESSGATYRPLWHSYRSSCVGFKRSDLLFVVRIVPEIVSGPPTMTINWKAGDGSSARDNFDIFRTQSKERSGSIFIFPFMGNDPVLGHDNAVDDHIFSVRCDGWTTGTQEFTVEMMVYYIPAWVSSYRAMFF